MSYQALARTWRPGTFSDLVGQEHVVKALVNALDDERLHHAYLFTGTRGVGKTTIARILAKCLNCETGVSSTPCGTCGACVEIDSGRFVDLIEVDAASRTKVDDTRELLDNVQYAPSLGRYKVYLIDEVHMLSNHSFNALLKTLEEPPPHVKFLLATTDPQKLPVTVLSRCLQFNLKRLPMSMIGERLQMVTKAESIGAEPGALEQIAVAADGSMRDALSLLDQAAAYCSGELGESDVRAMLGTIDQGTAIRLLRALGAGQAEELLATVAELDEMVPDYASALDELALLVQRTAVAQVAESSVVDTGTGGDAVREFAESIPAEDLQLYYQIALIGKRDLHLAPSARTGFEMILLRMLAFRPAEVTQAPPSRTRAGKAGTAGRSGPSSRTVRPEADAQPTAARKPSPAARKPSPAAGKPSPAAEPEQRLSVEELADWDTALLNMKLTGAARQLANNCQFGSVDGDVVNLVLDESAAHLQTDTLMGKLRKAVSQGLGRDIRIKIEQGQTEAETPAQRKTRKERQRQQEAEKSIESDPNVLAVQKAFGATVDPASIKPVKH
ncbi:MAG: DNA polymerase III subunit gamma/tau [Chromatiales bacterium]|nr:DNA polymerase III subunit gamma/tau [Chromatiales bacterium]